MKLFWSLFAVLILGACGGGDVVEKSCSYDVKVADGFVTNRPWIFKEGFATPNNAGDGFDVKLLEVNEIDITDICSHDPGSLEGIEVRFEVNLIAEEIHIGGSYLLYIEDNTFGTNVTHVGGGCVRVDTITDTMMTGNISFDSDGDSISGEWSATICN